MFGEFQFDCADTSAAKRLRRPLRRGFLEQVRLVLENWLASPEGQSDAYRPGEANTAEQFSPMKLAGMPIFLRLRQRRPAVLDDILPGTCWVSPSFSTWLRILSIRCASIFRAAIENGALAPLIPKHSRIF